MGAPIEILTYVCKWQMSHHFKMFFSLALGDKWPETKTSKQKTQKINKSGDF